MPAEGVWRSPYQFTPLLNSQLKISRRTSGSRWFGHTEATVAKGRRRTQLKVGGGWSIEQGMLDEDPLLDVNRLAVLRDLAILDTPAEPAYDDLARSRRSVARVRSRR